MSVISGIQGRLRRTSKRTAGIALGVVAVGVAGFLVYWLVLRGGSASAETDNRIEYQVQRGDITTSVSFSGSLGFADSEDLLFAGGGTVGEVLVSQGDTVAQGDVIARLDAASAAALTVAVGDAETALSQAQADYDSVASGAAQKKDIADAQKKLADAQKAVATAQQAMLDIEAADGADSAAVAKARTDVESAQLAYDLASKNLDKAKADAQTTMDDADATVADAGDAYKNTLYRWFGYSVPEKYFTMAPDDVLADWGVTLTQLFGEIAQAQNDLSQPWLDDPDTPWDEGTLWIWTHLTAATIDTESTELPSNPPSNVLYPHVELQDAWDAYQDTDTVPDEASISARTAVANAQQALNKAQSDLDTAQSNLAILLDPAEYQARKAALDAAEVDRDEAAAAVEQVSNDTGETRLNAAQAALYLAQRDYDDAKAAAEAAEMTAPFDGVVTAVNVEAGDKVNGTQVVATVVDTSKLVVNATVDEEDILSVKTGAPASVSLDAVAGRGFTGTVTSIGAAEQSQQGAVSFPVTVTLADADGQNLMEGLTAAVQVVNSNTPDVLTVPVAAVTGTVLQPEVERVKSGGESEMVPVQLGASNGTYVEVKSGLNEGDTVIATFASGLGLSTGSTNGQSFTPIGGGFNNGGVTIIQGPDGVQTFPGGGFNGGGRFQRGGNNQ